MDKPDERTDPKNFEGFIARVFEEGGLKQAVKEATKLFAGFSDKEAVDASATMSSKVRTAIMKMIKARKT